MMQNQTDVVFLIESIGFVGVCFDQIKLNYINPILQCLWGFPLNDDIGIINDTNSLIIGAVSYKGLDCLPSSICSQMEPTSNPKLFYEKIGNIFNFSYGLGEEQTHLADGLACALEAFNDLQTRRKQNITVPKHLVLIASQSGLEDIPVIESNAYRGCNYNDMIQELVNQNIALSIISPKYSTDFMKLYEKVNGTNTDLKIDLVNNNCFSLLMHNSVNINVQPQINQPLSQRSAQQQQQQQQQEPPTPPQIIMNVSTPQQGQQLNNQQQNDKVFEDMYGNTNDQIGLTTTASPQSIQQQQQNIFNSNNNQFSNMPSQQQQQQQPQNVFPNQPQQTTSFIQQTLQQPQQIQLNQQQPQQNPNNFDPFIQSPQQQQQPQQMQMNQPPQQQQQPQPQNPTIMHQTPNVNQQLQQHLRLQNANALKNQQQQQQQQQQSIRPMQAQPLQNIAPAGIQTQQGQQMGQQIINTMQMRPQQPQLQQQQPVQPQQQQQQQQQQQMFNTQQQSPSLRTSYTMPTVIWSGIIEWSEKIPNTNNKTIKSCLVKAVSQSETDFPLSVGQQWPGKLTLTILSPTLFNMLLSQIDLSLKRATFVVEGNNQDLRNVLSNQNICKGAFINFSAVEPKILVVFMHNNDIIACLPANPQRFVETLRQLASRQQTAQQQQNLRNQQLQQQQQQQQQQQGQQQQINMVGNQMQMQTDPNQDLRHLLSTQPVPQQQQNNTWPNQQQQPQQGNNTNNMYMTNQGQNQQQQNMGYSNSNNNNNNNNMDLF